MLNNPTSKKIAILGFGLEGKSLLKFLKKSPQFKKASISILDKKSDKNYLKNLDKFDLIFRSPGVPYNLPEIQKAIKAGVKFSSATQLFFDEIYKTAIKNSPIIIGITGTKGKGTTSTLLYKILKDCGKNAYLAGNIGKPAIEILPRLSRVKKFLIKKKLTYVILELSSFQLQNLNYSPNIAVVLDIFPDHLDAHKNLKEYLNAKTNIAKWQKKNDKVFYFNGDKYSRWIAKKSQGKKNPVNISFSNSPQIAGQSSLRSRQEFENRIKSAIKINGAHNFKNAIMATNVAISLNCSKEKIIKTIKNFYGLKHRLEFIRLIRGTTRIHPPKFLIKNLGGQAQNYADKFPRLSASISFYNDSASTNPQTAAAAIKSFPNEQKILIAGGKDKNLNYFPLAKALKNSNTKLVILFGENKNKIKRQLEISNWKLEIRLVKNIKVAIKTAYKIAKSLITNYQLPITVIFSPASASFDMFEDYKDRGEKFKEIVKKLK